MTSKQHFFPLFVGDFLASTATWEGEERALYLLLLAYQWSSGPLPGETKKLARMCQYDPKTFARLWETVGQKFVGRAGGLVNLRLEEHRTRVAEIGNRRAQAGAKGGAISGANRQAKSKQMPSPASDLPQGLPLHPIQSNPDIPVETSLPPVCVSADSARETTHTRRTEPDRPFAAIQAAYPKFSGRQDWIAAEHAAGVLIDRRITDWPTLSAAVERYATFVAAGGVSSPQYVLTPGKFFGAADRPWAQPWDPPPTKADTRLAANLSAADEFLRRTESAA